MVSFHVDPLLLRLQLPDLAVRHGALLAARVVQAAGRESQISLVGIVLAAQLPDGLEAGETLRLRVEEVTPERLLLRMVDSAPQAPPPAAVPVPLPFGGEARVHVEEQEAGDGPGGGPPSVMLAYDSPVLGRIDLRLELSAGAVSASVSAAAGEAVDRARDAVEALRTALAEATGRPALVRVSARRDPFEAYA